MNRSEKVDQIIKMLIDANEKLTEIPADKQGNRSKYIGRDQIIKCSNTILKDFGGRVMAVLVKTETGLMMRVEVHHAASGQWMVSEYPLEDHIDFSSKDVNQLKGGSITYGIRYTVGSLLGIAIGDDDYEPAATAKPQEEPKPLKKLWGLIYQIPEGPARNEVMNYIQKTFNIRKVNEIADKDIDEAIRIVQKCLEVSK